MPFQFIQSSIGFEDMDKKNCYRTRFTCKLCTQSLGYSAFRRHRELPRIYCPGYVYNHTDVVTEESDSESLNSTFEFDDPDWIDPPTHDPASSPLHDIIEHNNDFQQSTSSSSESESDINDSGLEVWDKMDDSSADSEVETIDTLQDSQLTYFVSPFLCFFPVVFSCFRQSFFAAFVIYFWFIKAHFLPAIPENLHTSFIKAFPSTLYSLRKNLRLKKSHTSYVVCRRCHKLYMESDCVLVRDANGLEFSPKCEHIEFPSHPQRARIKKMWSRLA